VNVTANNVRANGWFLDHGRKLSGHDRVQTDARPCVPRHQTVGPRYLRDTTSKTNIQSSQYFRAFFE